MDELDRGMLISMIIFILGLTVIIGCSFLISNHDHKKMDEACKKIGFVEYIKFGDLITCADNESNLHYVITVHYGWSDITFKEVRVGVTSLIEDSHAS